MSEESKKEKKITSLDLQKAISEEIELFLKENKTKIIERARKRLEENHVS